MLKDSLRKFSFVSYIVVFAAGSFITRLATTKHARLTDLPENIAIFKNRTFKYASDTDKVRLSRNQECLISSGTLKLLSKQEDMILAAPLKNMPEIIQALNDNGPLFLVNNDTKLP